MEMVGASPLRSAPSTPSKDSSMRGFPFPSSLASGSTPFSPSKSNALFSPSAIGIKRSIDPKEQLSSNKRTMSTLQSMTHSVYVNVQKETEKVPMDTLQPIIRPEMLSPSPTNIHSPVRSASLRPSTEDASTSSSLSALQSPITSKQDRFIPNRSAINVEYSNYILTRDENNKPGDSTADAAGDLTLTPSRRKFNQQLNVSLLKSPEARTRVVECRMSLTPTFDKAAHTSLAEQFQVTRDSLGTPKKSQRIFPSTSSKILDAPGLLNDYYLNLLHWGSNNLLSVALGPSVYFWHPESGQIDTLMTLDDESAHVASIQFSPNGQYMAVGTSLNTVQLWDVQGQKLVRELGGHGNRVSCLSWKNDGLLSSGGRDSMIINHDYRARRNCVSFLAGHQQEVCGLSWSPDESTLASGGNDNMLCIWDAAMASSATTREGLSQQSYAPRITLDQQHTAAVKAVSWCPWQRNILASGGGSADRTIRIWNASSGSNLKCVDTGSQVCAIQWSEHYKEIVSSHGFSNNQLIVWRYQDMLKLHELRGHTSRVLHLAKSPCGTQICSAATDETLRFWDLFPASKSSISSITPRRDGLSMAMSPRRAPTMLSSASSMSIR